MTTLQFTVGTTHDSPIVDSSTFQNNALKNVVVHKLEVDNLNENGLEPNPDFIHNPLSGTITRPYKWLENSKLIIFLSPIK